MQRFEEMNKLENCSKKIVGGQVIVVLAFIIN